LRREGTGGGEGGGEDKGRKGRDKNETDGRKGKGWRGRERRNGHFPLAKIPASAYVSVTWPVRLSAASAGF